MIAFVKEWWKNHSTAILLSVIAMAKAGALGKLAASIVMVLAGAAGASDSYR